jgi:hypothetical protein
MRVGEWWRESDSFQSLSLHKKWDWAERNQNPTRKIGSHSLFLHLLPLPLFPSPGIGIDPFQSLSLQSFGFEITFALLPDFRGLVYISIENMVLVCTDRLAGEQRTWF